MKKLVFAALVASSFVAMAELKLGVVDTMTLVRNHSAFEPNKKLLQDTDKDYQKRLDAMQDELAEIEKELKEVAEKYNNPMISQSEKTKLQESGKAIQSKGLALQQKMLAERRRTQQDLTELEARLMKAQVEDIRERVAAYAKKNGYDMIFDSATAIYRKDVYDVTDGVLKEMGVDPKKAKRDGDDESK